jgi:hypothetical protein
VVSHGGVGGERKPSFVEQGPEQSCSSQAEREVEVEVDLPGAEDIARQI